MDGCWLSPPSRPKNRVAVNDDASFGEVLASLADADPDAPAITCSGVTVTRREFHRRTNRLATAYAGYGVTRGSFVTIGLPNGIEFVESAFAVWKLGAVPQPVSHRLPPRELEAIVDLVQPSMVVGFSGTGSDVAHVAAGYVPYPDLSDGDLPRAVAPSWKAPTSGGSTGRPKVIVAAQEAVFGSLSGFGPVMGLPENGTMLTTGPLSHNGPFMTTAAGLLFGSHVVVMQRFDAAEALELIERHRVEWMYAVPTMMLRIWRLDEQERTRRDLSSLKYVLHLAAPCPQWLKRVWIEWFGAETIHELYAGTEVQALTVISGTEWLEHPGSVGRPVIGEIRVLDAAGRDVPVGTVGSLWMRRGEGVEAPYRYVGAEPRSIGDGWECLGDVGHVDADGYVYLTDRDTDMILVGGANVYPAEVEAALEEHPAVRTSCVVGLPDEDMGQVIHAVVEVSARVGDDELLAFCAERLAPYKLPRKVHTSAEALRDDAGKVRRSAVRQSLVDRDTIWDRV